MPRRAKRRPGNLRSEPGDGVIAARKALARLGAFDFDLLDGKSTEVTPRFLESLRTVQQALGEKPDGRADPRGPTISALRDAVFDSAGFERDNPDRELAPKLAQAKRDLAQRAQAAAEKARKDEGAATMGGEGSIGLLMHEVAHPYEIKLLLDYVNGSIPVGSPLYRQAEMFAANGQISIKPIHGEENYKKQPREAYPFLVQTAIESAIVRAPR